ncbi:MAG: hypothetical protein ACJ72C_01145, partial [Nitrososphaeraceae archaeon]
DDFQFSAACRQFLYIRISPSHIFKESIKRDPYRNGGGVIGDRFDRTYPPTVMSIFTLQTL